MNLDVRQSGSVLKLPAGEVRLETFQLFARLIAKALAATNLILIHGNGEIVPEAENLAWGCGRVIDEDASKIGLR